MRFIEKKIISPPKHTHHTPIYIYILLLLWLENVETPNYYKWKLFTFRKNRRAFTCMYLEASFSYWVFYVDFMIVLGFFCEF